MHLKEYLLKLSGDDDEEKKTKSIFDFFIDKLGNSTHIHRVLFMHSLFSFVIGILLYFGSYFFAEELSKFLSINRPCCHPHAMRSTALFMLVFTSINVFSIYQDNLNLDMYCIILAIPITLHYFVESFLNKQISRLIVGLVFVLVVGHTSITLLFLLWNKWKKEKKRSRIKIKKIRRVSSDDEDD